MTTALNTARPKRRFKWLRRAQRKLRYRFEAGLFHGFIGLMRLLGLERAQAFGGWLTRTIGPRLGNSKRARRNLKRAMPELSDSETETVIRCVWDSVGRTAGEYAHLGQFDFFNPQARVEIIGMDTVEKIIAMDKGGIFFSGHFANWELMPKALIAAGMPSTTVVRPVNNPHINDWLDKARLTHCSPTLISKNDQGARGIVQALRAKKYIAMLIDQKIKEGIPVPFFGQPAMTTPAPARLALKFGCPLIPAWIERVGAARYRLHVYEPIAIPETGDMLSDIVEITRRMNAFLEERIRERPDQWLWLHNRWGGVPKP